MSNNYLHVKVHDIRDIQAQESIETMSLITPFYVKRFLYSTRYETGVA